MRLKFNVAIPYLGSKRKSVGKIYQAIKNLNPEADTLVDLFCGGLAISEYFIKQGWKVIANDKNKYVVALIDQIVHRGLDEAIVTEFVTRQRFSEVLANPDNYNNWYVGYLMCVWSFGNNQVGYIFGKEAEPYKKAGHELVINKNPDLLIELFPETPRRYIDGVLRQTDWHKRRIALGMVSRRKLKTRIFELEQLERLERLQQLQRLEHLGRLGVYSKDYRDIVIPDQAVVYCDPPYEGTSEYREGGFNHAEFWEWVRVASKKNVVYVSEYAAPSDFKLILRFPQNSTYAGGVNKGQPDECLFCYNSS